MRTLPSGLFLAALALGAACSKDSPTGSGPSGELTLGTPVTISGRTNSERFFTVQVPAGAAALRVSLAGGTGDADLAVRFGARPSAVNFDCESFGGDNNEECTISSPAAGTWHIAVFGFESYSGAQLLAELATVTALTNGVAVTNLSGAASSSRFFSIAVPAGASSLTVTTSGGTGDVDLYTRFNVLPTGIEFDCGSGGGDNNESCTVLSPAAGTWYVQLAGFNAYAGVTLTASIAVP